MVIMQMPLLGWNWDVSHAVKLAGGNTVTITKAWNGHDEMFAKLSPRLGNGSRLSLLPRTRGAERQPFSEHGGRPGGIAMVGLSGGAWTTHMAAAARIDWGKVRLESSLAKAGYHPKSDAERVVDISVAVSPAPQGNAPGKAESYRLIATKGHVAVIGADAAGAMYGCLKLAERVRRTGRLPEQLDLRDGPTMNLRGTCILLMKFGKYDYPITPEEFPFFYDRKLWTEYLDFLATNRFNYIAFWNGHPFDYLVTLERYPEAQTSILPAMLKQNHDMLMWLSREAERRNIRLMFEYYSFHTSVDFKKAHGLPDENPRATPLLADYAAYCVERFVREYPI